MTIIEKKDIRPNNFFRIYKKNINWSLMNKFTHWPSLLQTLTRAWSLIEMYIFFTFLLYLLMFVLADGQQLSLNFP